MTKFSQKNKFTFTCANLWTYNRGKMLNILGFHAFNINKNKASIYMYQEDKKDIMDQINMQIKSYFHNLTNI